MQSKYTRYQFLLDSVKAHGDSDECLEWPWARFKPPTLPYGRVPLNGREELAHRLSYRKFRGEIPKGLDILHSCDNPPCYNPKHLHPGTGFDNQRECVARGRRPNTKGELSPVHKLTEAQIQEVHAMRATGASIMVIGKCFSISPGHVWEILKGKCWKHLPNPTLSHFKKIVHRGAGNGNHKLTERQVIQIHHLWRNGVSPIALAKRFSVCHVQIRGIIKFKSWAHLKPLIDPPVASSQTEHG